MDALLPTRTKFQYAAAVSLLALALLWAPVAAGGIKVVDGAGRSVRLGEPAERVVSLAPHITELLYAIDAGDRLVGAAEFSDYPAQARDILRVGRFNALDVERIVALQPDLIVAWYTGNNREQVRQLSRLGIPVYYSEPAELRGIGVDMRRLGRLVDAERSADRAARAFERKLRALEQRYGSRPEVRVFYEIWDQPLMTVNGKHMISAVIRLCGGRNVFAEHPDLAPSVSVESVVAADPQAIVASTPEDRAPEWFAQWDTWARVSAVRRKNLYSIHPDLMHRQTPRLLEGAQRLCRQLEQARARLGGDIPASSR